QARFVSFDRNFVGRDNRAQTCTLVQGLLLQGLDGAGRIGNLSYCSQQGLIVVGEGPITFCLPCIELSVERAAMENRQGDGWADTVSLAAAIRQVAQAQRHETSKG